MDSSDIQEIYSNSDRLVNHVDSSWRRYIYHQIDWKNDLIAIKGARGVGKTTLLLQYIKDNMSNQGDAALYLSLDDLWFANHPLMDIVDYHYNHGGTHLFLDEVHRIQHWQTLIKNIHDRYPGLKVVYTGSSMLKMDAHEGDLSRRQRVYTMRGLSFREFLSLQYGFDMDAMPLDEILQNHVNISRKVTANLRVLQCFDQYLRLGYYPFFRIDPDGYAARLQSTVNAVLSEDMPAVEDMTYSTVQKTRRMLSILAGTVPQTPKMTELYAMLETNRDQGLRMLSLLERASLLQLLSSQNKSFRQMAKPDKIYLQNPNLMFALTLRANRGTLRETFFMNQLSALHEVTYPSKGDFLVDGRWLFEVGGKGKSFEQIKDLPDSYLAVDDIETSRGNRVPLWLFGFLY